jgi:hypothetical protein
MGSRIVSRRDLEFPLFEVLALESLRNRPRFSQHSRETMLAAVDTALAIAEEKFAPHNHKADEHELEGARGADADFYRGKLAACYFFRWELPRIGPQLALLDSLDSTCLEAQPAWL